MDVEPVEVATRGAVEKRGFQFTGSAGEYFGIWIVNILLTVVTLGIYSAWAKVRRNRYFYGNTKLDGRGFDYHATGGQILVGRLIVFGFFVVYNIVASLLPLLAVALLLVILVAFPALISRAIRFGARVTSYNNVRFDFTGGYGGAAFAFIVGGIVAALSLGILAPLASRWMGRYVYGNMRYGNRAFSCDPPLGALYRVWVLPAVMVLIGAVVLGVIGVSLFMAMGDPSVSATPGDVGEYDAGISTAHWLILVVYLGLFVGYTVIWHLYAAGVRNVTYGATVIEGGHRLHSEISGLRYAWISASNVVVTVLTLGLMRPWAAVRTARFLTAGTAVLFAGPVGEVLSQIEAEGSAVGSEYVDIEGIDIGV